MQLIVALISGLLFGAGLTITQMVNPDKVLNFLDITGSWDPSLALVMGSALAVFGSGYFLLVKSRNKPVLGKQFFVAGKQTIDRPLLTGAVLFGLGWGITGICPGPAIANLSGGEVKILGFIAAMLVGMRLSGITANMINTGIETRK